MSRVEAIELKKDQYNMWDNLVEKSPQGTIFHTSPWLNTCGKHLNRKFKIIGCFKGENLIAGSTFFTYSVRGFLKIASSHCAITPYGGVVISRHLISKSNEEIIESICNLLSEGEFDHIELIHSPDFIDIRPFLWNGWKSNVFYTHVLDINSDLPDRIGKKKREIQRAIAQGIVVKKSNNFSSFYKLYVQTYERQEMRPPISKSFFNDIMESFCTKGSGDMWIAEMPSGEIASAEFVVRDNNRAHSIFTASDSELRNTNPNGLLINEIYNDLRKNGYKEWNHMMANIKNLSRYISQFDTRMVPYYGVETSSNRFNMFKDIRSLIG